MPDLLQQVHEALSNRYLIERELVRGGMAAVYVAHDPRHDRRVAIKVLDPEVAATIGPERFLREVATIARLAHPHILPLHDSGVADGLLYFVMPYVEGESLRDRLRREVQLSVDDALRIARELADALGYAHARGVVHRDVKPENVLMQGGHAVLGDFGVARSAAEGDAARTATGVAIGTPLYMSPEQAAGSRALDGRSDLYALACVLYEMLAGQPPFAGATPEALAYQHLNLSPRPVTDFRPATPRRVADALQRALAKRAADRFQTAESFAGELRTDAAPEQDGSRTEPATPRRRARGAWIVGGVVALAVASFGAWQAWRPLLRAPAVGGHKDWILVADFDGPPGDSTLAPAVRSLLIAGLDQSRIVATVPPELTRAALAAAGKPPNARVDATLARELAYRSAVRAVLEGTIGRLGSGYSIVLRVVDADTPRTLLTRAGTAKDDSGLIPALGEMAKQLRRGLGENRRALRATRELQLVATPSLEAYRLYVEGLKRYRSQVANRRAIQDYRGAIAIDPDFSTAWLAMAYPFLNLSQPESARACLDRAMRHPERLTPLQLGRIEGLRANAEGDHERALAAEDRILADDSGSIAELVNSADPLWALGRFAEALARIRQAMRLSPFGPNEAMRINEAQSLILLGRFEEAREANRRQTGIFRNHLAVFIELASGRFAAAESLALRGQEDRELREDFADAPFAQLSQARFGRGTLAEGAAALDQGAALCARGGDSAGGLLYRVCRAEYAVLSGDALPASAVFDPTSRSGGEMLASGLEALAAGRADLARRRLGDAERRPAWERVSLETAPALILARLAALSGRPREAVRLLEPMAKPAMRSGPSLTWIHWWLADSFEQMGLVDSAASCLERVLVASFIPQDVVERPWVHRRLALLYARLGRSTEAAHHLAAAEEMMDRPDSAAREKLEAARAAVRAVRGMEGLRRSAG